MVRLVGRDNVGAIVKSEIAFDKAQLLPLSLASSFFSTSFASFRETKTRKEGRKSFPPGVRSISRARGESRSLNRSATSEKEEKYLIIWRNWKEFAFLDRRGEEPRYCRGRLNATGEKREKKVGRPAKNSKRERIFPGNKFPSFTAREQPSKYGVASLSTTWKKLESLTHCR